jgi:hypothetical protein
MDEERLTLYTSIEAISALETRLQNAGLAFRKEKADLYVITGDRLGCD